jgi:hypothetical protein
MCRVSNILENKLYIYRQNIVNILFQNIVNYIVIHYAGTQQLLCADSLAAQYAVASLNKVQVVSFADNSRTHR